tara:strand:- start:84 stop:566 length:483 start_codon:yes stop_codon:yes gene_type:complete
MLGHAAIAEAAIADVGGVLLLATAEMSGISSASSVGVGTLVGVATLDANFTKTTAGILITGGANADLSFDFTQTTEDIKIVNFTDATLSTEFTQTSDGIIIASGVVTKDLNFTKTASGDILFIEINAGATPESYTEITPSGTETWTEITPSGTETWTEIQ